MVDKIGQINQVQQAYQANARSRPEAAPKADQVEISQAGRVASVRQAVASIVNGSPDIRADKVREAKEKLERGEYLSDKIIEKVAEKIADSILGTGK